MSDTANSARSSEIINAPFANGLPKREKIDPFALANLPGSVHRAALRYRAAIRCHHLYLPTYLPGYHPTHVLIITAFFCLFI